VNGLTGLAIVLLAVLGGTIVFVAVAAALEMCWDAAFDWLDQLRERFKRWKDRKRGPADP